MTIQIFTIFCLALTLTSVTGQTLNASFSADNCYVVYLGSQNSVAQKLLPTGADPGVINSSAAAIFNATNVSTTYNASDWFYVIAWSDDGQCQGLIGEFTGATTLKTGDAGWEVFGTGRDADSDLADAPPVSEINSFIVQANASNGWVAPTVGERNDNTSRVCRPYASVSKVNGISNDARWVWHDTGNDATNGAPFVGFNHDEFLIFRFPVELVSKPERPPYTPQNPERPYVPLEPKYNLCCPPIHQDDFKDMFQIQSNNLSNYRVTFMPTAAFRQIMQAYVDYRHALNNCLTSFTFTFIIRKPVAGTVNTFDLAPNTIVEQGWITFKANDPNASCWVGSSINQVNNGSQLGSVNYNVNKWFRIESGIWGSPTTCLGWDDGLCNPVKIDFNLQVSAGSRSQRLIGRLSEYAMIVNCCQ